MLASAEDNASLRSAEKAAKAKVTKHGPRCAAQNVTFLPLAVCAFGGWLPAGEEFVDTLAGRIAEVTGVRKGVCGSPAVAEATWLPVSRALSVVVL